MTCPDCTPDTAASCGTCGGDGEVPDWLADPKIMGVEGAAIWKDPRP